MMKIINIKNIALFVGLLCTIPLFNSCTKLKEPLYSQLGNDNFLKTEGEIVSALGAAYSGLREFQGFGNLWTIYCTTDEVAIVGRTGGDWAGDGQDQQMTDHKWISNNRFFAGTWQSFYGQINICNRLIYQLEQIDAEKYKTYISEIKTVRALWYLWLIDEWGNVPIVDKFDVPKDYLPKTSTRLEVYNFIEKEVKDNLANLSKDINTNTYGRATYWMAQSILAKLYLNAGVYSGTPQWQKAIDATNEIIGSNEFSLTANYKDNFIAQNQNSTEAIFAIPFDETYTQWTWFLPLISLHPSHVQTFSLTQQPWNGLSAQTEFFNLYEDNDIRKTDNLLWGPQYTANGDKLLDPGYEKDPAIDGDPWVNLTPTFISLYNTARQSGARIIKWEVEKGSNGFLNSDFFVFRYSDILLMKAEAMWRLDPTNTTSLQIVNQFRQRAGVAPFNSLDAEKIMNERGRELFMEGWRRSDKIRFGRYNDPTIFKPYTDEAFRQLYPIPKEQLDANPNLIQNPGY
ncbi:MAG: hypothetical protein BGO52_05890 [Sphingobacteriales bacterium 44-61]|nr:MAG: hypothetical protein BGO52_05890 [Sphingobacteriales bacterium 44-61]